MTDNEIKCAYCGTQPNNATTKKGLYVCCCYMLHKQDGEYVQYHHDKSPEHILQDTMRQKRHKIYDMASKVMSELYALDSSGHSLALFIRALVNTSKLPAYGITDENKLCVITKEEYIKLKGERTE